MTDWAALHARGLTAGEAAKAARTSVQAAYKWARRNRVRWCADRMGCAEIIVDWAALHKQGLTARQAAGEAGVSSSAARSWAQRNGLEWPRERIPAKGRAADISQLTPEQKRDFETLITLGGYTQAKALDTVTRPKVKVRAPKFDNFLTKKDGGLK